MPTFVLVAELFKRRHFDQEIVNLAMIVLARVRGREVKTGERARHQIYPQDGGGSGCFEIEQAGPVRDTENAERARHRKAMMFSVPAALVFIDQEPVCVHGDSKCDCSSFAGIEKGERGVGGRVRAELTPGGRLSDPSPYRSWVLLCCNSRGYTSAQSKTYTTTGTDRG